MADLNPPRLDPVAMAWNPAPIWATWLSATPDAGSGLSLTSASSQTASRPAPRWNARKPRIQCVRPWPQAKPDRVRAAPGSA